MSHYTVRTHEYELNRKCFWTYYNRLFLQSKFGKIYLILCIWNETIIPRVRVGLEMIYSQQGSQGQIGFNIDINGKWSVYTVPDHVCTS